MKWELSLVILTLLSSSISAQEPLAGPPVQTNPAVVHDEVSRGPEVDFAVDGPEESRLAGNRNFSHFIGFVSDPLQSIDPRAVTELYPIFGNASVTTAAPIPNGSFQVYGAGLTVALSDRFAMGLNQGGYAAAEFRRFAPNQLGLIRALLGPFRPNDYGGDRQGWLNLGGFFQYTLIEDVPNQFLLTGGLRWVAPCGSREVFQGHGPAHLAPYLTVGKEFGDFHVLATTGYNFPVGPGNDTTNVFYANLHLDRQCFGWLYPLVELNSNYHVKSVGFGASTGRGFIDLDNFESSGNILTLAVGADAVIIRDRLEFGAVYSTPLASQRDFDFNGLTVKLVLRY